MDRHHSKPEIARFQAILDNRTEGASALVEQFVELAQGQPPETIIAGLNACRKTFPLMAVWPNFLHQLTEKQLKLYQVAKLMEQQTERTVTLAAESLTGYEVLFTISNSSLVRKAILASRHTPKVLCAVSEPGGEGRLLASTLGEAGLQATPVDDSEIPEEVSKANAVVLGTDQYDDTAFINKVGSGYIAELAMQHSKPVLVLAEEFKRVPQLPELTQELATLTFSFQGTTARHIVFEKVSWQSHIRLITNKP
jgi:hypothetical protein